MSNRNAGGNQKMMMMVGLACVCCVCVLALGGGAYFLMKDDEKKPDPGPSPLLSGPTDDEPSGPTTGGGESGLEGLRRIKYGSVSMVAPSNSSCNQTPKVYFKNSQENDQHLWNFDPTNKDGVYRIRSEQKSFKKGCNMYLTAPNGCKSNSEVTLDRPIWADRQYWKVVPSGDGYQLMNVACENARAFPYMISKGASSGKSNTARMGNRIGTTYSLETVE